MIVFGGSGLDDTWALALSGQNQNQWSQLEVLGESSPPRSDSQTGIYDPFGQRLLVLITVGTYDVQLWELSLGAVPSWRPILLPSDPPAAEVAYSKMVLDRAGGRALIVGGAQGSSGTWSLSLTAPEQWTRVGNLPPLADANIPGPYPLGFSGGLMLDAQRQELFFFSVNAVQPASLWAMSLATSEWTERAQQYCLGQPGTTAVLDQSDRRMLFLSPSCSFLSTFSLTDGAWQQVGGLFALDDFATWVVDDKRQRVLYLPDSDDATYSLSFDSLKQSVLVPGSH